MSAYLKTSKKSPPNSSDNELKFFQLPFIYRPTRGFKNASNWRVPLSGDYNQACEIGRQYAAHFAQYLKDNPEVSGANLLGAIAEDIDFKDRSNAAGYWVGFFSYLEIIIAAQTQHVDVFGDVGRVNAYYAKMNSRDS